MDKRLKNPERKGYLNDSHISRKKPSATTRRRDSDANQLWNHSLSSHQERQRIVQRAELQETAISQRSREHS